VFLFLIAQWHQRIIRHLALGVKRSFYLLPHSLTSWLYGPVRTLASLVAGDRSSLSTVLCRHLLTFISRISFSTASILLNLGLAIVFLPVYSQIFSKLTLQYAFLLDALSIPIFFLFVCYYVSLCDSRSSWLVTVLHIPCYTTGPCILFSLFLSHVFSLFISATVTGHAAVSTLQLVSPSLCVFSV